MDQHVSIYEATEESPAWLNDDDATSAGFDHDPSEDQGTEGEHQEPVDHEPPEDL